MANLPKLSPDDAARRQKFMLLCGVGAVVVLFGMLLPHLLPTPANEAAPATKNEASAKALPPANEKKGVEGKALVEKESRPMDAPEAPSIGAILARLVCGTLFVLLLCAGTAYGVGRWMKGKQANTPPGPLKLVAALPINSRCSIFLVQAGDQQLVAGIDAGGLRALLHIPGGITELEEEESAPTNRANPPLAAPVEKPPIIFSGKLPVTKTDPANRLPG